MWSVLFCIINYRQLYNSTVTNNYIVTADVHGFVQLFLNCLG